MDTISNRKMVEKLLFGTVQPDLKYENNKKLFIQDSRKQGEYGQKKFIKP